MCWVSNPVSQQTQSWPQCFTLYIISCNTTEHPRDKTIFLLQTTDTTLQAFRSSAQNVKWVFSRKIWKIITCCIWQIQRPEVMCQEERMGEVHWQRLQDHPAHRDHQEKLPHSGKTPSGPGKVTRKQPVWDLQSVSWLYRAVCGRTGSSSSQPSFILVYFQWNQPRNCWQDFQNVPGTSHSGLVESSLGTVLAWVFNVYNKVINCIVTLWK